MDVVLCAFRVVQKKRRVEERRGEGGRGWPGKVPRSPAAPPRYLIGQYGERGRLLKKKKKNNDFRSTEN
jgi:hypothetical protein